MAVSINQTANPAGVAATSNVATYTGVSIGTAAPNRTIVVLVGTELASSTPSGCTIDYGSGDTAMTAGTGGNQGISYSQLYYLAVPTGTTATIKVTYSATNPAATGNHIAVYSVTGGKFSSTGADQSTDMDSTDPLTTGSITIPSGGGFIAIASCGADTQTKTWANATEDLDADVGTFRFCTATRTTALTTTAVTCTGTGNGEDGALSWIIFADNSSPTTALNSPADTATGVSTTPTLNFTGTDADSDAVEYEVQVDTANTFNSNVLASDNFNRADENPIGGNWTNNALNEGADNQLKIISNQLQAVTLDTSCEAYWSANTFSGNFTTYFTVVTKPGTNQRLELFFLKDPGTSTHDGYQAHFYDESGDDTFRIQRLDDAVATELAVTTTGTEYTSGDVLAMSIDINGTITLYKNGTSVLSVVDKTYTGAFYVAVGIRSTTGAVDNWGVKKSLIDAISSADAGFTAGHPFASGVAKEYTVQSALSASTTYYWRVRAIDPSGSNNYGAWSSTRSFTTASAGTPVTVNAGVQSSTFSQPSLTVTAIKNKTVSPNVQSATFSAISPTITTTKNPTVSPSVQSFTASQPSIQITVGDGVSAGVQSATFNAISPTITATRNPTVSLGVQSGVLSQISPSVTVTSNKTVSPNVQSATFTQQNITVTPIKNVSVALGVQSATFSQPSLGLTVGDGATPSVQSATFSAVSPTITTVQNRTVSTGVQSATFNLISPSVTTTTSKTVSLNVQSGVFSQPTPTITPVKNVSKAVGVQSAVFSQINPTVTAENSADSVTVSPSVQSKTFSAISPTVTTVRNVTWNAPVINLGYPKFIFDDKINLYKHITGRIYMKL